MFCRVVEEGSISQAARVSYVSQPAVTSQIRQLEKHYGVALFDRTSGKLVLTKAGSALYPYAKEIIAAYDYSEEVVKSIAHQDAVTLSVGASLTIGEYLLPNILGEFRKEFNNLKIKLTIGSTPNIMSSLEKRDIDIGLVEGIVTQTDVQSEKFGRDELILVIPKSHRWHQRDAINIEELVGENLIWREENAGIREIVENLLKEHQLLDKVNSYMELGSTQAIKSAVEAGLGISILPKSSILKELELGVLKHLPLIGIQMNRDLWLVRIPSRFPKESVRSFVAHLKKQMTK
jgi:molybdate transport repressor ModE-like protein